MPRNLPALPGVAHARANWGRWVADCPQPYCDDARQVRRLAPGAICEFGHAFDVAWPERVDVIEHLLALRPDRKTQNWEPGESVELLMIENLAHGISATVHPEVGAAAGRLVLDAATDVPVLRLLDEPLTIDAAPAREIGD